MLYIFYKGITPYTDGYTVLIIFKWICEIRIICTHTSPKEWKILMFLSLKVKLQIAYTNSLDIHIFHI